MAGDAASGIGLLGPLVVAAAAAVSAGLILLLHPLLRRYALARPNARSSHREPTPQGGGLAVIMATLAVGGIALTALINAESAAGQVLPVFAATALIAAVGAADDILTLAVLPRLLLQTLAVAVVILALPAELRILPQLPAAIEQALLILGGVWFVNLVNFMDGIDWITVAEVVPTTAALVLIGGLGALPLHGVVIAMALLGAMLGFAPYNRPVARLFLGDVGSLPIGLLLGWLLVLLAGSGHLAAALLLPLYYLADASITLLRRLRNGEAIWQAHRSHFYQRATDNGLSVMAIDAHVLGVNLALAVLATVTVLVPSALTALICLSSGCLLVAMVLLRFAAAEKRSG
jgi:UDP-N-acetylmuramyl pentapeptide phosphotransferase/UDP-N-acetylglucosamine-1-phosphate transferase